MEILRTIATRIGTVFAVLTDWFLILAGGLLVFKALTAVDVPAARYVIMAAGILLGGLGLWYRHRRKKRSR
jgi:hypothetical protein